MRVRVTEPQAAHELDADLRSAGCVSVPVDDRGELAVLHPWAWDSREETMELTFFLRAWQARHPSAALELHC